MDGEAASDGDDEAELYALLDDRYARRILVETYGDTRSASALRDACDASDATVYRRVDRLREAGLLESVQRIDPNGGHREVYAARLDRVTIDLSAHGFDIEVDYIDETAADRLTKLYEELSG